MKNVEAMNTNEIREELLEVHRYDPRTVAELRTKKELAIELQIARMNADAEESPTNFFNSMEAVAPDLGTSEFADYDHQSEVAPRIGSPAWQEYVLSHLEENEYATIKGNQYPKASGLRRVAQVLLGDIVESGPIQVFAPQTAEHAGRATVIYEVKIAWKQTDVDYLDLSDVAPVNRDIRIFREAADVWHGNTQDMFAVHPVATASTRAEGRALKKALQLSILVAEEMDNDKDPSKHVVKEVQVTGEYEADAPVTSNQVSMVKRLTKKMNIDLSKLLERSCGGKGLDKLTKEEGSALVQLLTSYNCKGKEHVDIPEQIKSEIVE